MKPNVAAGLLMYRKSTSSPEFFLVHPGGPYFRTKEAGAWSIPKGIPENDEALLDTARREFHEETGIHPTAPFTSLGTIRQKGGKTVHAWMFEGSWDPADGIVCNTFRMEWPPRSGKYCDFPEVDKAAWVDLTAATQVLIPEQMPLLERALKIFAGGAP